MLRIPRWAAVVLAGMVVGLASHRLLEPVEVAGSSMSPTLTSGQHIWVAKNLLADPEPGDVVAVTDRSGRLLIKRIVGVTGDQVAIIDGQLHRNGKPVTEPYLHATELDSVYVEEVTVPEAHVYLLGDNRTESVDSRTFGTLPETNVVGEALWIS